MFKLLLISLNKIKAMKTQTHCNKRRDFLTKACPTVVFAMFGLSFLEACSSDGTGSVNVVGGDGSNSSNNGVDGNTNSGGDGNTNASGFTVNGNMVTVDLSNDNFKDLETVGGNVNILNAGVLLLRVSDSQILAFDNCCPHNGAKDSWTYNNDDTFTCGVHGNTFNTDQGQEVSCGSNNTTGKLVSYTTSITDQTLTIQK